MDTYFLQQFCDLESQAEYKNAPFINGDYVVATDAHIMAIIDKEIVDDYSTLKELERDYVGYIEKSCAGNLSKTYNITLEQLKNAESQVEIDTKEYHVCEDCNGDGTVDFEYISVRGESFINTGDCPVCEGTGISPDYKYLRNRDGWYCYKETTIDIDGIWLAPNYIDCVINTMNKCGVKECILESYGPIKHNIFHINNNVKIVVMPINHTGDIANIIKINLEDNNDNDEAERAEYERLKKKFEK